MCDVKLCPHCGSDGVPADDLLTIAYMAGAMRKARWRPIDTAPKDGTAILGLWADHLPSCVMRWDGVKWTFLFGSSVLLDVMHPTKWMPITPTKKESE